MMRKLIQIVENADTPKLVYHGSDRFIPNPKPLIFVSPSLEMAQGYAIDRATNSPNTWRKSWTGTKLSGVVTVYDFLPNKIALESDVMEIWKNLGHTDGDNILFYKMLEDKSVLDILLKNYDAVSFQDYGMHSDFDMFPAYLVLNPKTLVNPRIY